MINLGSYFTSKGKLLGTCFKNEKRCIKNQIEKKIKYGIRFCDYKTYQLNLDLIKESCSVIVFSTGLIPFF